MAVHCKVTFVPERLIDWMRGGSWTVTLKLCISVSGGFPSSVTTTPIVFVLGACWADGVHAKTPLIVFTVAPEGGFKRLNASVFGGWSGSVATLVNVTVAP